MQPNIGLSLAVSIRVGNELGAGNPHGAKKASFVAIGCTRKYNSNITVYLFTAHHSTGCNTT